MEISRCVGLCTRPLAKWPRCSALYIGRAMGNTGGIVGYAWRRHSNGIAVKWVFRDHDDVDWFLLAKRIKNFYTLFLPFRITQLVSVTGIDAVALASNQVEGIWLVLERIMVEVKSEKMKAFLLRWLAILQDPIMNFHMSRKCCESRADCWSISRTFVGSFDKITTHSCLAIALVSLTYLTIRLLKHCKL